MEPRIFHGELTPGDIARALLSRFNHGNLHAQQFGSGDKVLVQIASRDQRASGGNTALSVSLQKVTDGLAVVIGKQDWFGVAASLGWTALATWRNPWTLINRLDDLAQDIENLQLSEKVWEVIESEARTSGASFELSERLRRLICVYCNTPNPMGENSCLACGAPLGDSQPVTCKNCGFVIKSQEAKCPNCGKLLG